MKKAKIIFLTFLISFVLGFIAKPQPVLAGNYWSSQIGMDQIGAAYGEDPANPKDIRYQIIKIINVILTILGLLVTILIIFAGFQWMTSGGNEEKVKKAQGIIKSAVIGLIIIMLAWSVTYWTLRRLEYINKGSFYYLDPEI